MTLHIELTVKGRFASLEDKHRGALSIKGQVYDNSNDWLPGHVSVVSFIGLSVPTISGHCNKS